MQNYALTVCYDGTRYRGWQKQGNTANTIQEKLETLLSGILEQETELAGAGRTDAGVHARKQVCSFRAQTALTEEEILGKLRDHLPEDIGALALHRAPPRFHARLSCREKSYLYRIWNSAEPNVFERKYLTFLPCPLDTGKMEKAASLLTGEHDFTAFCSNRHMKKSAVRLLKSIEISRRGDEIDILCTGSGFLYNMVRIIAGTLIEAGRGERDYREMPDILASRDRQRAGFTAPAQGLTLWDLIY